MMQRNIFYYSFILLFVLLSCSGKNSKSTEKNDVPIDTVVVSDTLKHNNLTFVFDAQMVVLPSIKDKDLLDSIYFDFFEAYSYSDTIIHFQPKSYVKKAIKQSLTKMANFYFDYFKQDFPFPTWEYEAMYDFSMSITPAYYDENLLISNYTNSGYWGGAHGFYHTEYKVFDLLSKKQIRNTDVFKDVKNVALEKTMLQYFQKAYEEDEDRRQDCLFEEYSKQIPVNDNFYFDGDSIYFIYNQYEITPYACGIINFSLPFNEIQKYLKPEFVALLKKYFKK